MAKIWGHGVEFYLGDSTAAVGDSDESNFDKLLQVRDFTPPAPEVDMIDVRDRDSEWVTKIPGFIDGGDVEFDVWWDPHMTQHGTGTSGLEGLLRGRTQSIFRVVTPAATGAAVRRDSFEGFLTNIGKEAPQDDGLAASITIAINGTGKTPARSP